MNRWNLIDNIICNSLIVLCILCNVFSKDSIATITLNSFCVYKEVGNKT